MSTKPTPTMLYWGYGYSIFLFTMIILMTLTAMFITNSYELKIGIYTTCLVFSLLLFFYINGLCTDKEIENQDKDNSE